MRLGLAPSTLARPLGLLALGALLSELMTSPSLATMHWSWTLPSGLTWLLIGGCAISAWLIGYRRGVSDAINGSRRKPHHRLNED
jgi:hypothetical protein